MTDDEEFVMPSWAQIIEALEADPGAMTAGSSPTTADIVAQFPELASVDVSDLTIDGPHGDVPARLYRIPGAEATAALVWVHGGGFIDLDMPEVHWVALTLAARGVPVLSVEYRKCLLGVRWAALADPCAFAANGEVGGQPPVFILNSEADALRASGEAYAEQLQAAGVDVTVECEPGVQHGHLNEPDNPGGRASLDRMTRWLEEQAAG